MRNGRSILVVAGGSRRRYNYGGLTRGGTRGDRASRNDIERPGTAAPLRVGDTSPRPPRLTSSTRKLKVDGRPEFRSSTITGSASAPQLQDEVEVSDTRALRSPSPDDVQEAREDYDPTALAPLPPLPTQGRTGWTRSNGEGFERDRRRRIAARRSHSDALRLPSVKPEKEVGLATR